MKNSILKNKSGKISSVSVFILLFISIFSAFFVVQDELIVKAHDFDDWQYFKVINLDTSNDQNNFQYNITVYKANGHDNPSAYEIDCEGNCLDNFNDVRFADADDNSSLYFWKDTGHYSSGTSCVFWFKSPSDATSDQKIIMWYGKTGESDNSDGANTFEAFEDEDWSTDWTEPVGNVIEQSATQKKIGSYAGYLSASAGDHCFWSLGGTISYDCAIDFWFYPHDNGDKTTFPDLSQQATANSGNDDSVKTVFDSSSYNAYYSSSWHTVFSYSSTTWIEISWRNIDFSAHTYNVYKDGSYEDNANFRNSVANALYMGLDTDSGGQGDYIDCIRLRKDASTFPEYDSYSDEVDTEGGDETAPTPNPMTWSSSPAPDSTTQISMTCSQASDDTDPQASLLYKFWETTGHSGATTRDWTANDRTHTDTGLSANTQYTYLAQCKDTSENIGGNSTLDNSCYTHIETPTGIDFNTITASSIQVKSTNTPSNLGSSNSGLYVEETVAPDNNGWQQANDWWTDSGLSENTQYTYRAKAKNGDEVETGYCGSESKYTLCTAPSNAEVTISGYGSTWVNVTVDECNNPSTAECYINYSEDGGGNSGWVSTRASSHFYNNFTGLTPSTEYCFYARYRNGDDIATAINNEGECQTTSADTSYKEICYYNISGLDGSDRVTFGSGNANSELYSNATGNWGAGAMLQINISTNVTLNVSDVFIDLVETDLHTSVYWENISISVDLDNASWHSFVALTSVDQGGDASNVSLDASWSSLSSDANPFPIENNTVGVDDYIYIRFKLDVPSDADAGGPYTTDSWLVVWETTEV